MFFKIYSNHLALNVGTFCACCAHAMRCIGHALWPPQWGDHNDAELLTLGEISTVTDAFATGFRMPVNLVEDEDGVECEAVA